MLGSCFPYQEFNKITYNTGAYCFRAVGQTIRCLLEYTAQGTYVEYARHY